MSYPANISKSNTSHVTAKPSFLNIVRIVAVLAFLIACVASASAQTVITRVEEQTGWSTCGACGNTGGTGYVATYSMTRGISSPSLDGSSAKFSIGGNYAYADAYWYYKYYNPPTSPLKSLKYEFDLYVPAASANAPQAIEFECEQKVNGKLYNFAWQDAYKLGKWRVFNYSTKHWESTTLPYTKFTPDTWHHIIAEYRVENGYAVHDALTIDGVRHAVNIRHAGVPVSTGRYLSSGFQLDLDKYATDFKVYVDRMKVTYTY